METKARAEREGLKDKRLFTDASDLSGESSLECGCMLDGRS